MGMFQGEMGTSWPSEIEKGPKLDLGGLEEKGG